MKEHIKECQEIDANCNDCKFFERVELVGKGIFKGKCNKKNIEVLAYPCFYSGHYCFEHRSNV
jgi:hypothetical protein